MICSLILIHIKSFRSDVNAFLDPYFGIRTFLFNYFACFAINGVIVLAHMVCYGRLLIFTGRRALLVALVKFLSKIFSVYFLCSAILTPKLSASVNLSTVFGWNFVHFGESALYLKGNLHCCRKLMFNRLK